MGLKVIITGTTGMVGRGVLYESLESEKVDSVLIINRQPLGITHPKLKEIIVTNFFSLGSLKGNLTGYDACYFCLGVSSAGMSEEKYSKLTYDLTVSFAEAVVKESPALAFFYVSGTGTDSSEKGRIMWARVKGRTENKILSMPFRDAYMFRPGFIQPMKGVKSKTKLYNALYVVFKPLYPLFNWLAPKYVTTSVNVGKAMINLSINPYDRKHLENNDINIAAIG